MPTTALTEYRVRTTFYKVTGPGDGRDAKQPPGAATGGLFHMWRGPDSNRATCWL